MTLLVRATGLVNGKPGFSDPRETKTLEPIDMKRDISYCVRGTTAHAKSGAPVSTGGGATNAWSCRPPVFIFYIRYLFTSSRSCTDCTVWPIFVFNISKDVFLRHLHSLIGANYLKKYFPAFFCKNTEICITGIGKTSIGNNFSYVKDSAVMFADIIGFSAMADRIMRPRALSRDRKWPRLFNRHKRKL